MAVTTHAKALVRRRIVKMTSTGLGETVQELESATAARIGSGTSL
jgi:hypothetical protein